MRSNLFHNCFCQLSTGDFRYNGFQANAGQVPLVLFFASKQLGAELMQQRIHVAFLYSAYKQTEAADRSKVGVPGQWQSEENHQLWLNRSISYLIAQQDASAGGALTT